MTYLGDTLTVGLILILLFGSIALYLYTRIQQAEQKVSLLESIVLDLKLTGEIQGFSGLPSDLESVHLHSKPASRPSSNPASPLSSLSSLSPLSSSDSSDLFIPSVPSNSSDLFIPSAPSDSSDSSVSYDSSVSSDLFIPSDSSVKQEYTPFEDETVEPLEEISVSPISAYDHMTMKEIQGLIRSRGLTSEKGAKKSALIELLKRADASNTSNTSNTADTVDAYEVKLGSMSSSSFLETSGSIDDNE